MPRTRSPYPEEFRRKIVELVRTGRTPHELSREFEPTAVTISNWVKQAEVIDALQMAIQQRRPEEVVHHSDQGSQYTSLAFGKRCREANVRPSMGSIGDCYDNALCESFFATLECELLDRHRFRSRDQAGRTVFEFIEGWYNPHRRHSSIGYASPVRYEREHALAA